MLTTSFGGGVAIQEVAETLEHSDLVFMLRGHLMPPRSRRLVGSSPSANASAERRGWEPN